MERIVCWPVGMPSWAGSFRVGTFGADRSAPHCHGKGRISGARTPQEAVRVGLRGLASLQRRWRPPAPSAPGFASSSSTTMAIHVCAPRTSPLTRSWSLGPARSATWRRRRGARPHVQPSARVSTCCAFPLRCTAPSRPWVYSCSLSGPVCGQRNCQGGDLNTCGAGSQNPKSG